MAVPPSLLLYGTRKSLTAAGLIGFGTMAAADEIVFHQILAWHHFYDRATPAIGAGGIRSPAKFLAIFCVIKPVRMVLYFPPSKRRSQPARSQHSLRNLIPHDYTAKCPQTVLPPWTA